MAYSETRYTRGWPFSPAPRGARFSRAELEAREQALRGSPLFAGISKRHLREIARVTGVVAYPEGRVIITEGHEGSSCWVVLDGRLRVMRGRRTLTRLGPGEIVGEISLLDPGPRTASVMAETDSRCLTLGGVDLRGILEREPVLAMRVATALAQRLRELDRSAF